MTGSDQRPTPGPAFDPRGTFDLRGKVVAITGGNQGIGLGMARGLAGAGADVAILGRRSEANRRACDELGRSGVRALPVACDVGVEGAVDAALDEVVGRLGRLDGCFANAGIAGTRSAPFVEMTDDEWRSVLRTNLDGAMFTLRAAARHMVEAGRGGSLVATSSLGALDGFPRNQHYAAGKAALMALVRGLAVELGPAAIRCNALVPGLVRTEMSEANAEVLARKLMPRIPARRWGEPEDFAGIAVYLVSDLSTYHTGTTIVIDGGYSVA